MEGKYKVKSWLKVFKIFEISRGKVEVGSGREFVFSKFLVVFYFIRVEFIFGEDSFLFEDKFVLRFL